jgi:predicted DCC family thiol-disulfide oxidoreductase YuxK
MIQRLTVLYDENCGFCVRCQGWLLRQPAFVELECCAAGSREAARRFPELRASKTADELLVIDDEGGIYCGARAWLMCLWALSEYREWAGRLASPLLLPFARGAFAFVSSKRRTISELMGFEPEQLRRAEPPHCVDAPTDDLPDSSAETN